MEILKYIIPKSINNWSIVNIPNYFNFIIVTFDLLEKDKQLVFVNNIKLIIGLNFCSELQLYLFKKSPDHKLIKYL